MKSVRLCAYVAILIFSLASFPVAGADTWQGGNRSCSVAEWLFPVEKPLQRYLETVSNRFELLMTLSTGGTAVSNVMETPDALLLLQEFFTELHNASQEVVKESASTIEDCDLSDEVQNFLSTPVDVDPLFDELIQVIQNTSESFPLEFAALVDTCRTVPALEAIGKFTERVYTLESLADEINDMDQIAMQALPPDLLVMIYGMRWNLQRLLMPSLPIAVRRVQAPAMQELLPGIAISLTSQRSCQNRLRRRLIPTPANGK